MRIFNNLADNKKNYKNKKNNIGKKKENNSIFNS